MCSGISFVRWHRSYFMVLSRILAFHSAIYAFRRIPLVWSVFFLLRGPTLVPSRMGGWRGVATKKTNIQIFPSCIYSPNINNVEKLLFLEEVGVLPARERARQRVCLYACLSSREEKLPTLYTFKPSLTFSTRSQRGKKSRRGKLIVF